MDEERETGFRVQLIGILNELKSHKDCVDQCKKLIDSEDKDTSTKKHAFITSAKVKQLIKKFSLIYYYEIKAKIELNDPWSGYFDLIKAESLSLITKEGDTGKELDDLRQVFEMKLSRLDRNIFELLLLSGSNKSGVLGTEGQGNEGTFSFLELRNRMIRAIACEEHYCLVVVNLCCCVQSNSEFSNCLVFLT